MSDGLGLLREASATGNKANSSALPPHKRKVLSLELSNSPPPSVYDLLTRFWKHPLPNPAMDAHSTVDGLPDAGERDRADKAGWITREFTLSLEIAVELIGRGIPFLVALVEAGFSQPRLCVGADAVRGTALLADGLASTLAARLIHKYTGLNCDSSPALSCGRGLDSRRLKRVCEFIDANLGCELHLDQLAQVACLSQYHFARAFKKATGHTVHQYLTMMRLQRAKELLAADKSSIADIAFQCSFSSQANFTKAFVR